MTRTGARHRSRWVRAGALVALALAAAAARPAPDAADLIVHGARITTQADDPALVEVQALAVRDGIIVAVGRDEEVLALRGQDTVVVDAGGRRVLPGLVDAHLHAIRGGRFWNLELRWDGVDSLARALAMLAEQAARTPQGQWVRVVGGWSPEQFAEQRLPTVPELDAAAPHTPVFVLLLYSQGYLNRAGVEALGLTPASVAPPGGRYEFVEGGAILHAEPSPAILYGTIGKLPSLSASQQLDGTRRFFRELNRFGLTGALDPGGGGHAFPQDYAATCDLASGGHLPLRLTNQLFAQVKGHEREEYVRAFADPTAGPGHAPSSERALDDRDDCTVTGAGENLVWAAGDFENFLAPRPELEAGMEAELAAVVRPLAERGWPLRLHATYDETVGRMLDVLEPIFAETHYGARWWLDHVETIGPANIARLKALGGGVAVQDRMAFAGEMFVARYGAPAAAHAPPLRALLDAGLPVAAGTDATRVSSYNPWVSLQWLVTGRTVGGLQLAAPENHLGRDEALRLYTLGSAWCSGDETRRGRLLPGQDADFALLSDDYFVVPEERLGEIESLLTVTGGEVVHAAGPFEALGPAPLPPVDPPWSPVAVFPGYPSRLHDEAAAHSQPARDQ